MTLDFYHNKIVGDVISEEFEICFKRELAPLLTAKYGEIDTVQMYEDYIADNLMIGEYWYYPLSLVIGGETKTQWIRWQINKTDFDDGLPYAFSGSGKVGFELCDVPRELEARIAGRSRYYPGGSVNVRIEVVKGDSYRLSGRYSQTFIDEMARQLTPTIETATGVTGIADSSVELVMVFASGTYMEHISDNVTYRRLMLVDKVSAPRDFWIKWTRLNGAVAYPVSAHVSADNILFELGEDVDHKIREKEYRYLLSSGKEKYHNSMSRKKVTEWREVIKRAARRGELFKIEPDLELAPETLELKDRIADLLGKSRADEAEHAKPENPYVDEEKPESDEFARALEKARMFVEESPDDGEAALTLSEMTEKISASEDGEEPAARMESDGEVVEFEDAEAEDGSPELELTEDSFEPEEEAESYDTEETVGDETEENGFEIFDGDEDEDDGIDIFADEESVEEEADSDESDEEESPDDKSEYETEIEELASEDETEEEFIIDDDDRELETEAGTEVEDVSEEISESEAEELIIEDEAEEESVVDNEPCEEERTEEFVVEDEPIEEFSIEEEQIGEFIIEDEPVEEFVIEEKPAESAEVSAENTEAEAENTETEMEDTEAEETKAEEVQSEADYETCRDTETESAPTAEEPSIAERVADIRSQIETRIRLEYETRAREKAECELAELRQKLQTVVTESEIAIAELKNENERLRREYDRLVEQIESERFTREADEARRRIEDSELRLQIEKQLRAEAAERERLAESARIAIEEQRRLEEENARISREREEEARAEAERKKREEEARAEAERKRKEEHERELEAIRQAEAERIRREREEQQAKAEAAMPDMSNGKYAYATKTLRLLFDKNVDPNITKRIKELIKTTVDYYNKDTVYLRIRASITDNHTVILEFVDIPMEEMPLLYNIIKVLGGAGIGVSKAILE